MTDLSTENVKERFLALVKQASVYYLDALKRGNSCEEQKNHFRALDNYVMALSGYARYVEASEDYLTMVMDLDIERNPERVAEKYFQILNRLSSILCHVAMCYQDLCDFDSITTNFPKQVFVEEKIVLVYKKLVEFTSYFSDEELESLDEIKEVVLIVEERVEESQNLIDELKKKSAKEIGDSQFNQIRASLQKISKSKLCPIALDSASGGGCFIATAAYETSYHPDLDTFRVFRDDVLLQNHFGKLLVSLYYKISPSIAQNISRHPALRLFLRHHLTRLAQWMREHGVTSG